MKNITVHQYAQLQDTSLYDAILDVLKPKQCIYITKMKYLKVGKKMNVNAMPYVNVKYCMRLLGKANGWDEIIKLFDICFGITEEQFWKMSIVQFFHGRQYLIQEFKRLVEVESRVLASQSTDEHLWQMAGADKLKPYNDTLPLVQLGKMFGQYPFELGRKPYGEVFSLLAQVKVQNEVETEYQKLKTN